MICNILWDLDGTLFDTYPAFTQAFALSLADFGASAPGDKIAHLARQSFELCIQTLAQENNLDSDPLAQAFFQHYQAIPLDQQPPFPYAREICAYIVEAGGLNVLATHRSRASILRFLKGHNLKEYFAGSVCTEDGYPPKPDPAMFEALITQHDLERSTTLVVGDRDLDIQAGIAAGLPTCAFGSGPFSVSSDHLITDFSQLYHLLISQSQS